MVKKYLKKILIKIKNEILVPVTFIKRPIDTNAIEGDYAEFYCKVAGKPEPKIVWKKDGKIFFKLN